MNTLLPSLSNSDLLTRCTVAPLNKQTPVLRSFLSTCHVGARLDPLAKEQRLHTLGHGDDDVGSAHRLLHRGTHRHRTAHRLAEPLRSLSGVVPHAHLWRECRRHYTSIPPTRNPLPKKLSNWEFLMYFLRNEIAVHLSNSGGRTELGWQL